MPYRTVTKRSVVGALGWRVQRLYIVIHVGVGCVVSGWAYKVYMHAGRRARTPLRVGAVTVCILDTVLDGARRACALLIL